VDRRRGFSEAGSAMAAGAEAAACSSVSCLICSSSAAICSLRSAARWENGSCFFLNNPMSNQSPPEQDQKDRYRDQHNGPGERQPELAQLGVTFLLKNVLQRLVWGRRRVLGGRGACSRENGEFKPRGVPLHAAVFDSRQRPGQLGVQIVLGPRLLVDG